MANLYAVLIGINGYKQCRPLEGCINDVKALDQFFQELCLAQENLHWHPSYLLEPGSDSENKQLQDTGLAFVSPSRQNIIDAFKHFDQVQDGDFCLLYYSGHGSTVAAPDVLKGYEPGDILQTIVCADSRINGSPDLLDKEIGYLIAKAMDGKAPDPDQQKSGVHFLAIFDSCHSGTVTRGEEDRVMVARMAESGPPTSTLEGFTTSGNCYYVAFEPGQQRVKQGGIRHARHINLSAARNTESAIETAVPVSNGQAQRRGVFTWSLLETLKQSSIHLSYAELMRRVTLAVRTRVDKQIPVLGKTNYADDDLFFFRNQLKPLPAITFYASYDNRLSQWVMDGGTLNGIPDPVTEGEAYVNLGQRKIRIISTGPAQSELDPSCFTEEDKEQKTHAVTLDPAFIKKIKIGLSPSLSDAQQQAVKDAFKREQPTYAMLAAAGEIAQYLVKMLPDRKSEEPCFVLTRPGSNIPLFMRTPDADTFVSDAGKVCRYDHVLGLNNPSSDIPMDAVSIRIQTLEGVDFDENSFESISKDETLFKTLPPQSETIPYPAAVRVSAKLLNGEMVQPAIRVRIEAKPGSSYWVGALYCDEKLSISAAYLPTDKIGVGEVANYMEMNLGNGLYMALPLEIDKRWFDLGVTEIQDYLIVFVSTQAFNLSQYEQEGIELDITRSISFAKIKALRKESWQTIKIPIHVSIPRLKQTLVNGRKQDFGAFSIQAPENFKAGCEVFSPAMLKDNKQVDTNVLPPQNLWDGIEGAPEVFAKGVTTLPDAHLNMLELSLESGTINQANPLILIPSDPLGTDELIVPYGLDITGQWISLGYTDEQGNVRIEQLPIETKSRLGQETVPDSSIKIFFQKIFKTTPNHAQRILTPHWSEPG